MEMTLAQLDPGTVGSLVFVATVCAAAAMIAVPVALARRRRRRSDRVET
jgi:hypothetical protein